MRLFIAFDVSEEAKRILENTQKQVKLDGKATLTKEFHLTLKFLGEVPEEKLDAIKQALEKIKFEKFDASLDGVGAFPDKRNPRVVWVGLEPHEKITALQQQVDAEMNKIGFPKEDRFHPHLTLARIKFLNNRKDFENLLDNLKVPESSFNVSSFSLIKSTLTPEGPVYENLGSFRSQQ
ncbi:RNA 2',3'-cyclic phosphodiesterase [Candidatus Woesearchaeota archaeon]|nr:RNA 2',3'-cyclic phosphodiesterase [Candidatus Woesearchaeota archaeon]